MKRAPARSGADDKKLQQTLKKLGTQPIQAIEEVNMFKSDGNVIHFAAPKGMFAPWSRKLGCPIVAGLLTWVQYSPRCCAPQHLRHLWKRRG